MLTISKASNPYLVHPMKQRRNITAMDLPDCVIKSIFCHLIADGTVSLVIPPEKKLKNALSLALCNSKLFYLFKQLVREINLEYVIAYQENESLPCQTCGLPRHREPIDRLSHILHEYIHEVEVYIAKKRINCDYCTCQIQRKLADACIQALQQGSAPRFQRLSRHSSTFYIIHGVFLQVGYSEKSIDAVYSWTVPPDTGENTLAPEIEVDITYLCWQESYTRT